VIPAAPVPPDHFDAATAVEPLGAGRFATSLDEHYTILGKPNGGYLLAVAARAATQHLAAEGIDHPHCLAASASYVRTPEVGSADLKAEIRRAGRRISHVSVTISQGGEVAVEALLSCGLLAPDDTVHHDAIVPPPVPPPEECELAMIVESDGTVSSLLDRIELRLDPATSGYARGEVAQDAEVRGWVRLVGERPFDPFSLLLAADTLPPATFQIGSQGWVPTIQLSVYIRGIPAPGWLVARQHARTPDAQDVDVESLAHAQDQRLKGHGRRLRHPIPFVAVQIEGRADEYIRHHAKRLRSLIGDLALVHGWALRRLSLL